ncbi:MAG: acetylglutamate kinase [Micrococcales bacterium 73-13]|nr:MAG: acetylglutamate kinase [Micrococcales bacterium 73-13]
MDGQVGTDTSSVRIVTTPEQAAEKAAVLVEALPWLHRFHDAVVVVKLGGNAMVDPELTRAFAQDMAFLRFAGLQPVVVHGGGPQITAALAAQGIASEFRGGYRVTSAEAMPVIREVLVEQVAAGITERLERYDDLGVRLPGDAGVLTGVRKGVVVDGAEVDLGRVGEVVAVNPGPIRAALDAGRVPVVSTVAREQGTGRLLNVNADSAAAAIATALGAAKLVVLTDVAGLYADWPDTASLIAHIDAAALRAMLPSLESGMIPKMEACLAAVEGGVSKAAVIDGRQPHSVLLEIFTDTGIGTEVVA